MKFIQQAYNGINEWWAYVLTIFMVIIGWQFIGVLPLLGTAFIYAEDSSEFMAAANETFTTLGIDSNFYLFLMILSFLFGLISLLLGIKIFHKRKIISVITSRARIDWGRIVYAFSLWAIIGFIMITIGYLASPGDFVWNFKPGPFIGLLLISFLFLPIQTSMEEILFRGYLLQGFALWFKKSFVALILTSVIFGLLHGLNPEVEKLGWITMVYYIGTGLVLGIFTLMDEGIELALGFHAANNIIAAVLVTTDWAIFQTEALLIDISEPSVGWEMFVPVFVLYPILLVVFSKKYGWSNWNEKLFGKVSRPLLKDESEF